VIWITTPKDGALKLADRLEQRGVAVRDDVAGLRNLFP